MLPERQKVAILALLTHLGIKKDRLKNRTRAQGQPAPRTLNKMRESGVVPERLRRKDRTDGE